MKDAKTHYYNRHWISTVLIVTAMRAVSEIQLEFSCSPQVTNNLTRSFNLPHREQKRLPESGGPRCEGSLNDCGGRVFSEDWSSNGASDYHGACFNFRNLPASPFAMVMKWPSGMKGSFN
ncbi:hypothetical protein CDAR_194931 [Caerostris darwini]|uniref:Secreted protein n=1 Tax=Caerostris darwini TaxID=1538125 RepID=A0AAV4X929_9ARAC|nr:hypothetical protein CDAR_194931 [Caerostris darwini]